MHLLNVSVSLILAALSTRCAASELDAFAYTCIDSYLNNPVLFSKCQRFDGSLNPTYIDLNNCLENTNGILYCTSKRPKWVVIILRVDLVMTWHHHYVNREVYSESCTDFRLSGTILSSTCQDTYKVERSTSIDLGKSMKWLEWQRQWIIMNRFLFK